MQQLSLFIFYHCDRIAQTGRVINYSSLFGSLEKYKIGETASGVGLLAELWHGWEGTGRGKQISFDQSPLL